VCTGWCICLIIGTKRGTSNIKKGNNTSDYIKTRRISWVAVKLTGLSRKVYLYSWKLLSNENEFCGKLQLCGYAVRYVPLLQVYEHPSLPSSLLLFFSSTTYVPFIPSFLLSFSLSFFFPIYLLIYLLISSSLSAFNRGATVRWGTGLPDRKFEGSISYGVIAIFQWHNPSGRTMVVGSTQPLTETSTTNISWGVKAADT